MSCCWFLSILIALNYIILLDSLHYAKSSLTEISANGNKMLKPQVSEDFVSLGLSESNNVIHNKWDILP